MTKEVACCDDYRLLLSNRHLSLCILCGTEQRFSGFVIGQRFAQIGQYGNATLDGGARGDVIEPALDVWELAEFNALIFP